MKLAARTFRREYSQSRKKGCYYITSKFGWRKDPISGEYKGHKGCDYGTNGEKYKQYALEDGVVESTYKDYYGAICTRIAYPRINLRLTYAHLDKVYVKTGQKVNADTVIGLTGTTGYSTGIHLHLGVRKIGSSIWIDPESIDYQEPPKEPEEKPEEKPEKKPEPAKKDTFKAGESVIVNGFGYASSDGHGNTTRNFKDHKMKILKVKAGAKYPYACNQYNTGNVGDSSKVTAWFKEDSLKKV